MGILSSHLHDYSPMKVDYTRGEGNHGTGLVAIKTGCAMFGLRIHPWGLLLLLAMTLSLYERYQKKDVMKPHIK